MKLQTKLLKGALDLAGRTIKPKCPLPILVCVKMSASNGELLIESSSIDTYTTRRVPCDGDLAPVCVRHESISRIVGFQESEELTIELDGRLKIKGDGRPMFLSVMDANEFVKPVQVGTELAVNAMDVSDAIRQTAWSAKPTDDRCSMMMLRLSAKKLECWAFSGYTAAIFQRPLICEDRRIIIPASFATLLVPVLCEAKAALFLSGSHLTAQSSAGSTSVKLGESLNYDMDRVKGPPRGKEISLSSDILKASCQYAMAMNDDSAMKASLIHFQFTGTSMILSSRGGAGEWSDEWSMESQPEDFWLDARYVNPSVSALSAPILKLSVCDSFIMLAAGDLTCMIGRNIGE